MFNKAAYNCYIAVVFTKTIFRRRDYFAFKGFKKYTIFKTSYRICTKPKTKTVFIKVNIVVYLHQSTVISSNTVEPPYS